MIEPKLMSHSDVYDLNDILKLVVRAMLRFRVINIDSTPEQIIERYAANKRISANLKKVLIESVNNNGTFDSGKIKEYRKDLENKEQKEINHIWNEILNQKTDFSKLSDSVEQIIEKYAADKRISAGLKKVLIESFNSNRTFDSEKIKEYRKDSKNKRQKEIKRIWSEIQNQKTDFSKLKDHPFLKDLLILQRQIEYLYYDNLTPVQFYNVLGAYLRYAPDWLVPKFKANIKSIKDSNNNNADSEGENLLVFPSLKILAIFSLFGGDGFSEASKDSEYPLIERFLNDASSQSTVYVSEVDLQERMELFDPKIKDYLKKIPKKYLKKTLEVLDFLHFEEFQTEFCRILATFKTERDFSADYQAVSQKHRHAGFLLSYSFLWRIMLCSSFDKMTSEILPDVIWLLMAVGNEELLQKYFATPRELIPTHKEVTKMGVNTIVRGLSSLQIAADYRNLDTMEYLLKRGASLNLVSHIIPESFPLHYSVAKKKFEEVKLLLSYEGKSNGSSSHLLSREELSVLIYALREGVDLENLNYLLAKGLSLNLASPGILETYPLHYAAVKGKQQEVKLLLSYEGKSNGSCKDLLSQEGFSVVTYAARADNLAILQLLINKNSAFENQNVDSKNAIHWSIENKNWDMFLVLLKYAKSKNCTANVINANWSGKRPLDLAYKLGLREFGKGLIKAGVDMPNSGDKVSRWSVELVNELKEEAISLKESNNRLAAEHIVHETKRIIRRSYIQTILLYGAIMGITMSILSPLGFILFTHFGLNLSVDINVVLYLFVGFLVSGVMVGVGWIRSSVNPLILNFPDLPEEKDLEKGESEDEIELDNIEGKNNSVKIPSIKIENNNSDNGESILEIWRKKKQYGIWYEMPEQQKQKTESNGEPLIAIKEKGISKEESGSSKESRPHLTLKQLHMAGEIRDTVRQPTVENESSSKPLQSLFFNASNSTDNSKKSGYTPGSSSQGNLNNNAI